MSTRDKNPDGDNSEDKIFQEGEEQTDVTATKMNPLTRTGQ
tara:strand:- start:411 stop:533 length:123 start_codon:yes stop_codon:yes gene_type:complete